MGPLHTELLAVPCRSIAALTTAPLHNKHVILKRHPWQRQLFASSHLSIQSWYKLRSGRTVDMWDGHCMLTDGMNMHRSSTQLAAPNKPLNKITCISAMCNACENDIMQSSPGHKQVASRL
eukprot:364569-Chlamydomonas_euryale.AAC.16